MKKYIFTIILLILFIPYIVNAETCDTNKISISSIEIENQSDDVEELSKGTASDKSINLNLSMSEVGDNIKYKIVVKNDSNEDYELGKNSLNINSDYIDYTLESENNNYIVNANSSKTLYLKIEYKNKVPEDKFETGSFVDNKTIILDLSTGDTILNPNTKTQTDLLILIFIILITVSLYFLFRKRKYTKTMLIIGLSIIIPISGYALCKCDINIKSKIVINKGDAITVPFTGIKYGVYASNNKLIIGNEVSPTAKLHLDSNDALEDWIEEIDALFEMEDDTILINNTYPPFYLKHIIEKDILKESYLTFVITQKMKESNPELKIGTYEIMGNDENSYETNKEIMKEAFGYSNNPSICRENSNSFRCNISSYYVNIFKDGKVESHSGWYECSISSTGESYCYFLGF